MKKQLQFIAVCLLGLISYSQAIPVQESSPVIKYDRQTQGLVIGPVNNGQRVWGYPPSGWAVRPTGRGYNYYAGAVDIDDEVIRARCKMYLSSEFIGWKLSGATYEENRKYLKMPRYIKTDCKSGFATFNIKIKRNEDLCGPTQEKWNRRRVNVNVKCGQRAEKGFTVAMKEYDAAEWPDYWKELDYQYVGAFYGSAGQWVDGWKTFSNYPPVRIGAPLEEIKKTIPAPTSEYPYSVEVTAVGWPPYVPKSVVEYKQGDIELAADELTFLNDTTALPPSYGIDFQPVQWRAIRSVILEDEEGCGIVTDREISINHNECGLSVSDAEGEDREQVDFEIKVLGGWYMPEFWATTANPLYLDPNDSIMAGAVICPGCAITPEGDPNVVFPMEFYIAESSNDGLRHLVRSCNTYIAFTDANGIGFEPYPILIEETDPDIKVWHVPFWNRSHIKVSIGRVDRLVYPYWLSGNAAVDFNDDGIVNLEDWVIATRDEPTPYPLVSSAIPPLVDDTPLRAAVYEAIADRGATFATLQGLLMEVNAMIETAPLRQVPSLEKMKNDLMTKIVDVLF